MLNGKPYPPAGVERLRLLPGVGDACNRLRDLGFTLVVVTNQPDIARGKQTRDEVDRIHDALRARLPLDEIVVCAHDDIDDCPCRKPQPGMILDAATRLGLDLEHSVCIGDRWRDVEAGKRAGDGDFRRPWLRRAPSHGCRCRCGELTRRRGID